MISNTFLIFVRAAEYENFNTTAKKLNLTPSAISHAISKLEKELDLVLFVRKKKGVYLTEEGRELLEYVQKIVDQEEELMQKASLIKGQINGTVRIGVVSSVCKTWIPEIILTFKQIYPKAKIIVKQGAYAEIYNWLENGEVDLGFLSRPQCVGLNYEFLCQDELMCVLPKGTPTKNNDYVTIDELKDMILIQQPNENSMEPKLYQSRQLSSQGSSFLIEDDLALVALVGSGIGYCVVPTLAIEGHSKNVDVKSFKPKEYREICLAWHKERKLLPLTKEMITHIIDFTKKLD